jgi:putative oxidoreductase
MKFMKGLEPLALLALRGVLALIFVYHGYPKLTHPTESMRAFFVSHDFPGYFLGVAGTLECFGALLIFLGIFARPAGLTLAAEMGVAIWKVHSTRGIMAVNEFEFPLAVAAGCLVLATVGAGSLSLDNLVFGENGKKRRPAKSSRD